MSTFVEAGLTGNLGNQATRPAYDGRSILNVPSSLCRWLGASELEHPAIDDPKLDSLMDGARQIVVVLADALGHSAYERWREASFLESAHSSQLTSVVPSTTSAALTTLWTGRSPAEHGVLGFELFLREYGLTANMITHEPMTFWGDGKSASIDPVLSVPTIGPHLQAAGVAPHVFMHYSIAGSGLSAMLYPGVEAHSFGSLSDLWIGVRQLAETPLERPRLIWVYFAGIDTMAHRYGPMNERVEAEYANLARSMTRYFVEPFSGEDTALVLMADHGQITTRVDPHFELRNHPEFTRRLHMNPTGENRLPYLHIRPGQVDAVEEYLSRTWPGAFISIPSAYALEAGLFGPGKPAASTLSRLGDRVLVCQDDNYLWWADRDNPLVGRHGGLTADEMLVPFVAIRLG